LRGVHYCMVYRMSHLHGYADIIKRCQLLSYRFWSQLLLESLSVFDAIIKL
jgi:hypothetical protein